MIIVKSLGLSNLYPVLEKCNNWVNLGIWFTLDWIWIGILWVYVMNIPKLWSIWNVCNVFICMHPISTRAPQVIMRLLFNKPFVSRKHILYTSPTKHNIITLLSLPSTCSEYNILKCWQYSTLQRVCCWPCDRVADRELRLTPTAQHQESVAHHTSVAREKIKIKTQSRVSTACMVLSHLPEVRKS